ncbi:Hpt domain-containing protein [Sphingobacterium corticibacter]|uniref:HPt domain-containing protein n=1 Tax=Sphingobacterium corticibacter TaxID=2171749 RepID=A0A2T8HLW6_9SPHI|nr:Hpt domain-containing protein [Sphingobacterium corticibacter]PVH26426.1 hypothetical protein DC487_02070 [Sphingobacterium corticibacter]
MSKYLYIQPDLIKNNMFGDDQMIKTFIGMYLTHCQTDFNNLSQAVEQQDLAEISSKAHHMKPTMAYIGAKELHVQFQVLETAARRGTDLALILPLFHDLKKQFNHVMMELDHFYSSLS